MTAHTDPLHGVEALAFDVFGTVVDWHGSVTRELKEKASASSTLTKYTDDDWADFATEWRSGYLRITRQVADGGEGQLNVDRMHRQILEEMLKTERWSKLAQLEDWDDAHKSELNMCWHRLDGWPDSSKGLHALKKRFIISTLSNGNVRLLVDMAKHSNLPWDCVLSAEMMGSFKPNLKVYEGALQHLSAAPHQAAMVAAHIYDLRAAAKAGMRTVYVRRPTEDTAEDRSAVMTKAEGGEVDVVVDGLDELAKLTGCHNFS